MASAGAADADGQIRFSLAQELRQQEVQEAFQFFFERLDFFGAIEVGDDGRMAARQRLEVRHVVGVGQKAHVKHEIGIERCSAMPLIACASFSFRADSVSDEVSMMTSAASRIGLSSSRSAAMLSLTRPRSESGCLRLVSE